MVAVEGAAAISGDDGRQGPKERPKPAFPGAGAEPETTRTRSS